MIRGFMADARRYVQQNPGQTAQEIFRELRRQGRAQSDAQDPQASLVATLHKYHTQVGLERRKEGGAYRYYPRGYGNGAPAPSGPTPTISAPGHGSVDIRVRVPSDVANFLDGMMAANEMLHDRGEAILLLIKRTMSSRRAG
jgi:hypothetical protein